MLMSRVRARSIVSLRVLLAAVLLAATLAGLTGPSSVVAAPPADNHEQTDGFLRRLLDEINARRALAGTQPLTSVPSTATAALDGFLAQTLPELAWPGPCVHHLVDGEGSWSYVQAAGFGGEMRGEVLACPGPEEPYWTPGRTADEWWSSPAHFEVLYGDPDANTVVCSAAGVQGASSGRGRNRGGSRAAEAASAVLCVTFHDLYASSNLRVESATVLEPEPAPAWQANADDEAPVTHEAEPTEAWDVESDEEPALTWEAETGEEPVTLEGDVSAASEAEAVDEPDDEPGAWEAEPTPEWTIEPGASESREIAASDRD